MTIEDFLTPWPPADCPKLAWPTFTHPADRHAWYYSVIQAYVMLWEGHVRQAHLAPVSESALCELESRIGCSLPQPLRAYHLELGTLSLGERLCSVTASNIPIQALFDAYPGIVDLADNEEEIALAKELIVFGDYLGNGNMFCFRRGTDEVYYFDHDTGALLTRFFSSTQEYLDALMIRCLAEIYDDEKRGEDILAERFGNNLVRKWFY